MKVYAIVENSGPFTVLLHLTVYRTEEQAQEALEQINKDYVEWSKDTEFVSKAKVIELEVAD
jgi:hypothetical protein